MLTPEVIPPRSSHHSPSPRETRRLGVSGWIEGDKIPLTAQILQITDIYGRSITDRPYRQALCHKEAIATMRAEAGRGWWNSSLIDELEALLCWQAPSIEASRSRMRFSAPSRQIRLCRPRHGCGWPPMRSFGFWHSQGSPNRCSAQGPDIEQGAAQTSTG